MNHLRWLCLLSAALLAACGLPGAMSGAQAPVARIADSGTTLYVSALAPAGGDGTRERPFDSLQTLEAASAPGDTLVVLPAPLEVAPLDGGIALKPGQKLIGDGPDVVVHLADAAVAGASTLTVLPRIRNTRLARLNGDAVRLAEGAEVRNLVITESVRGAIYGLNVPGARVHGNDLSGYNTACFIGFTVERFTAPTRAPYLGIPLILPAGWAGILVDAKTGSGAVSITSNYVHDSACGNGIDLRITDTADYQAEISGNFVTQLKQGPFGQTREFHLVHAITTQITDNARLLAHSTDNTMTFIGGPGADCEGLFMNLAGSGYGVWTVMRNIFERGIGGFSCNGLELVISNGPAHGEMYVSDSRFIDNPGDTIQQDNLGSGSTAILHLDRVIVRDTTERGGKPENAPLPFNLGECILAGSTGTDNTTVLRVRDSTFENCNNGLTILSGVSIENGVGPDGLFDVEVINSRFRNNAFYNIVVGVITPLRELRLKVENSDLSIAGDTVAAFKLPSPGSVEIATLDFGGGELGSRGGNCLFGGAVGDVISQRFSATLQNNWWGQPGGPAAGRVSESAPGSLDVSNPLSAAPSICTES